MIEVNLGEKKVAKQTMALIFDHDLPIFPNSIVLYVLYIAHH